MGPDRRSGSRRWGSELVSCRRSLHDKERALEALCRHLGLFARAGQERTPDLPSPEHAAKVSAGRDVVPPAKVGSESNDPG